MTPVWFKYVIFSYALLSQTLSGLILPLNNQFQQQNLLSPALQSTFSPTLSKNLPPQFLSYPEYLSENYNQPEVILNALDPFLRVLLAFSDNTRDETENDVFVQRSLQDIRTITDKIQDAAYYIFDLIKTAFLELVKPLAIIKNMILKSF